MPSSPPRSCSRPGCPNVTTGSYCSEHKRVRGQQDYAARRESSRFYKTRLWLSLRKQQLIRKPFCEWKMPDGKPCGRIGQEVDHVIPRRKGGADELHNLQTLCTPHHSMKTRGE